MTDENNDVETETTVTTETTETTKPVLEDPQEEHRIPNPTEVEEQTTTVTQETTIKENDNDE